MQALDPVQFELKYCERCGGLWLRPRGALAVYCAPCALQMNQLPPPRPVRRSAAPPPAPAIALLAVLFVLIPWLARFLETLA